MPIEQLLSCLICRLNFLLRSSRFFSAAASLACCCIHSTLSSPLLQLHSSCNVLCRDEGFCFPERGGKQTGAQSISDQARGSQSLLLRISSAWRNVTRSFISEQHSPRQLTLVAKSAPQRSGSTWSGKRPLRSHTQPARRSRERLIATPPQLPSLLNRRLLRVRASTLIRPRSHLFAVSLLPAM